MANDEHVEKFKEGIQEIGTVQENPNGGWNVNIEGASIRAKALEDLLVVYEVFYQGFYNYVFTKPSCVVDIGMNIGVSSLFFAQNRLVEKIYGYEPFQPTYDQALENFKHNPEISSKITPNNIGLLDENKELEADYAEEAKARAGILGIGATQINPEENLNIRKESVLLQAAHEAFQPIVDECREKNMELVVKIDCEGSEYAIMHDLEKHDLLKHVHVLMMEWHLKGPQEIEEALTRLGFRVFSVLPHRKTTGILFATNTSG